MRKPLGRLRLRKKDNIKVGVYEIEFWVWTALIWLRTGQVMCCFELGNELLGSS